MASTSILPSFPSDIVKLSMFCNGASKDNRSYGSKSDSDSYCILCRNSGFRNRESGFVCCVSSITTLFTIMEMGREV